MPVGSEAEHEWVQETLVELPHQVTSAGRPAHAYVRECPGRADKSVAGLLGQRWLAHPPSRVNAVTIASCLDFAPSRANRNSTVAFVLTSRVEPGDALAAAVHTALIIELCMECAARPQVGDTLVR